MRYLLKLIAPYGKEPPFVVVPKEKARITPYGSTSYRVEVQKGRWIETWECYSIREGENVIAFRGRLLDRKKIKKEGGER